MNINFEKIIQVANSLGLNAVASKTVSAIETICSRNKLHVAFVGGQNSGKTMLINAISHKEVREVSNISLDDERPLRITFEKTDIDPRFECVDVYDKGWNEAGAVVFEFKSSDLISDGKLTSYANDIDVIFYLISAMNAFTAEDVTTINALKNHNVKLILTKMDSIEEESRSGVVKYVNDVRSTLKLSEPIMMDKTTPNVSKLIRDALPLSAEQKEYEEKYCNALLDELITQIQNTVNAKISDIDNQLSALETPENTSSFHSDALKAKNNIMELGISRSRRFDSNMELANILAKKISDSGAKYKYSDEWKESIKNKIIEPLIIAEFESENKKIKKYLFDDCSGINPSNEETTKLKNEIEEVSKISAHITDIVSSNAQLKTSESILNLKVIGVTAAVVAGALIIPMPTLATWIVSAGAIAVGTGVVVSDKTKTETEMWNKNIKDYATIIAKQFYDSMKIYNNEIYEKLSDYVFKSIKNDGIEVLKQQRQAIEAQKEQYLKMLSEIE